MTELWVEKYRPSEFKDVKGQEKIVERVKSMVKQRNVQNLLFAGPAGIGKSTLGILIARKLFGDNWRENFMEMNASDERKIDDIRTKVKSYVRMRSISTDLPKIIFLDEADALTKDAQNALRRMMEKYSNSTRFILSCNFSSRIIDPIQSRCTVFRFRPLEKEAVSNLINRIAKEEKLKVEKKAIDALYDISDGDARKVLNILQSCAAIDKNVTEKLIYEIVSAARPKEIKEVLEIALKKDFIKARDKLLDTMLKHGLSGLDVIKQIQKEVWDLKIKDEDKVKLIEKCGEIEFRMVEGSDEFVQLEALLASFTLLK